MAFLRGEEVADFTYCAPEGVDGPDGPGAQQGLELCESHLDWIFAVGGRNKNQAPLARMAASAAALL